ncbi:MAG: D-glycero-beta-D-manno-heptose 1-phosphate adenylyltransferase [Bacteroidetes bacterium]|nr:D-glycero-beta-D-manno-heptose 1-phosphate adenylyltransferase [Bacteroidota bacterium]MBK8674501.1 D-glycero-beta-D-manno-heptose 1-phosphate adenylyltransferase [Bacteroidota bacterium]
MGRTNWLQNWLSIVHKNITISDFVKLKASFLQQKIVFTNGCFDLLHPGHIYLLQEAKKLGDLLVVGINSDQSIKRLKGTSRPIEELTKRIDNLAQLDCVDFIISFEDDTPIDLIKYINPSVLLKGGDYTKATIIGADLVERNGGNVVVIPLLKGFSTTNQLKNL